MSKPTKSTSAQRQSDGSIVVSSLLGTGSAKIVDGQIVSHTFDPLSDEDAELLLARAAEIEPKVPASALAEALRLIEGLAGQQAMQDDFFVAPLARLQKLLADVRAAR